MKNVLRQTMYCRREKKQKNCIEMYINLRNFWSFHFSQRIFCKRDRFYRYLLLHSFLDIISNL